MERDGAADEDDGTGRFAVVPTAEFGWTAYAPGGPSVVPADAPLEFTVEEEAD
jgi:hypothetical protein